MRIHPVSKSQDADTNTANNAPNPKLLSELSTAARVFSKPCSPLSTFDAAFEVLGARTSRHATTSRALTDEDLVARDTALPEGLPDLRLVPVHARGIDVPATIKYVSIAHSNTGSRMYAHL